MSSSPAPAFAQTYPGFRTFYAESLRRHGIVGGSFMLIRDNQVVGCEFFGLADLAGKRPVDEETIYHWASITKTFTGIAVMQLRDRGRPEARRPRGQVPQLPPRRPAAASRWRSVARRRCSHWDSSS